MPTLTTQAPALSRQPSTRPQNRSEADLEGTSRTLMQRAMGVFEDKYETGEFRDPPVERAYPFGPRTLTAGHKALIRRLRDECKALSNRIQAYQDRAESSSRTADESAKKNDALIRDLRQASQHHADEAVALKMQLRAKNDEIKRLTAELSDAHGSLGELDRTISVARAKRRSWMPTAPVDFDTLVEKFTKAV